ncbi:hypothetical protein SAMN05518801_101524 [Novosphingobium sp. CF614]|uniref:hypothetical protein n=1 Tax=Novosphingobium sp. CF614 TaxID=1884364 RepID=UPI0008E8CE8C|nr:hypothetical protein [Novosphingobium sp. CF614]SFF78735.1 hypothetical protein SAMN05518801_101524 [Novosphingobium sp. CF614]
MFAHVPVALGIQLVCWAIGHGLGASNKAAIWMGCFAAAAVCIMREITQREYQWIEKFGDGRRANMPDYAGLEVWQWNAHSISETVVAVAASLIVAALVSRFMP